MTRTIYVVLVIAGLLWPASAHAQSDAPEMPLGDVARSLRKDQGADTHTVIDNDNLSEVMEEVESRRLTGTSLVFSIDQSGKGFKVSSPDITCSLSFNAQAAPLISDQFVSRDLPDADLSKLDGPASLSGDILQVSLHNGTDWILREITVGLTIVRHESTSQTAKIPIPKLVPAAQIVHTAEPDRPPEAPPQGVEKHSDVTVLIHLKGAAPPLATAVFRQSLGAALSPDQEWHWAIVKARGIPPQPPLSNDPQTPSSQSSSDQATSAPTVPSAPQAVTQDPQN